MNAACALHPAVAAVEVCSRCGTFLCAADLRRLDAKVYCPTCVALPEVDYVEAYRQSLLGRRDGWAWLFGLGGVGQVVVGLLGLADDLRLGTAPWASLPLLLLGGVGVAFWLGVRWARWAVLALDGALLAVTLFASPRVAAGPAMVFLVALVIFNDTRNQLFFRVDVARSRVEKLWRLHHDNPLARNGFFASFLGLGVPGLSILTAVLCAVGLARVNPNAHPPVRRRGQAIAGLVISAVGILFWGTLLVRALLEP